MEKTTNYEIFRKNEHNRDLCEGNVQKIMRSIKIKNLLEHRPILVNKDFEVIDGQHRLEACKRLGIEIYYEVKKDASSQDIILLNDNSKNWTREDYLNYFCAEGNQEYLKLKSFMEKHKISLGSAIVVLGLQGGMQRKSQKDPEMPETTFSARFRKGKFTFPSKAETTDSEEILLKSNTVIQFALGKLVGNNRYLAGSSFRRALYIFFSIRAVDFDTFMDKINHRLDLLRPCSRINDYVNLLKAVYNWKNRNPITLDEFEIGA